MTGPTAFISWAHSTEAWKSTVLDFATSLRTIGGLNADLDLWHSHAQWSVFGPRAIEESNFTLLAMSSIYKERWEGTGPPDIGAGAAREAAVLKGMFDRDRDIFLRRVKVVILPGATEDNIPLDLFGYAERVVIDSIDEVGLDPLLRLLYDDPKYVRPPIGKVRALPSHFVDEVQETANREQDVERAEDDAATLRRRIAQLEARLDRAEAGSGDDALRQERDALSASLEALSRAGAPGAENLLSVYLQGELQRARGLRNGIRPAGLQGVSSLWNETTEPDVDMWVRRVRRVLRDNDPELLTEFDHKPLLAFMDRLGIGDPLTPRYKKSLDQRIANLENLVAELQHRGL